MDKWILFLLKILDFAKLRDSNGRSDLSLQIFHKISNLTQIHIKVKKLYILILSNDYLYYFWGHFILFIEPTYTISSGGGYIT